MSKEDKLKLDHQLCFPLYAAARKVVGLYTPHLSQMGLTYTQYIVFLTLWEKDGVSVGELGKRLMLDSGTLTPLLKKLEKQGYITRERKKTDERTVLVTLTEKGRELKKEAVLIPEKVGACITLPPEDALQLYRILYTILSQDGETK